jgi:hypothetical protein
MWRHHYTDKQVRGIHFEESHDFPFRQYRIHYQKSSVEKTKAEPSISLLDMTVAYKAGELGCLEGVRGGS